MKHNSVCLFAKNVGALGVIGGKAIGKGYPERRDNRKISFGKRTDGVTFDRSRETQDAYSSDRYVEVYFPGVAE